VQTVEVSGSWLDGLSRLIHIRVNAFEDPGWVFRLINDGDEVRFDSIFFRLKVPPSSHILGRSVHFHMVYFALERPPLLSLHLGLDSEPIAKGFLLSRAKYS